MSAERRHGRGGAAAKWPGADARTGGAAMGSFEPHDGGGARETSGRMDPSRRIRPYTMTGGRTRPQHDELELDTLVTATARAAELWPSLSLEQQSLTSLCQDVVSVAEVAAQLGMPVNVVRILIGDLADDGLILIHQAGHGRTRPDVALLERVLYGLRTI
jgi:hypothetical protein